MDEREKCIPVDGTTYAKAQKCKRNEEGGAPRAGSGDEGVCVGGDTDTGMRLWSSSGHRRPFPLPEAPCL